MKILSNFENKLLCMKKSLFNLIFILLIVNVFAQQKTSVVEYINKYQKMAVEEMKLFKIPASVTLAQGILETSSGNSVLALNANNHFGIKCKKEWTGDKYYYDDDAKQECFRKYKSDTASYRDHSIFLSTREYYKSLFLLDPCDYKGWAYGLKKAGYATEPLYAEMLIKIIEENMLFNFDCPEKHLNQDTLKVIVTDLKKETLPSSKDTNHIVIVASKPKNEGDDFTPIPISGTSRKINTNNGVNYINTRKKDNLENIASDLGISVSEIMRFNDIKQQYALKEGEMIYIEVKKKRAIKDFHIADAGETMLSISQTYGIQLKELYSKNHMKPGEQPKPGQKLWLRNSKPE